MHNLKLVNTSLWYCIDDKYNEDIFDCDLSKKYIRPMSSKSKKMDIRIPCIMLCVEILFGLVFAEFGLEDAKRRN